jgi:2-iminobutanoate/2-iminopropanoate deaminase
MTIGSEDIANAYRIRLDPDPYEQFRVALGYRIGDVLHLSGQAAYDEAGEVVGAGDFTAQATQVFANLERVLHGAGSSLAKVFMLRIYLTDMAHYDEIVELRKQYFGDAYPADTIVEVSALPNPALMLEIEATALRDGEIVI